MNQSTLQTLLTSCRKLTKGRYFVAFVLSWCAFFSTDGRACVNSTVRDGAFLEPRDIHRLCVMANGDNPAGREIYDALSDAFKISSENLNVQLLYVAADDPAVVWGEYGIPSAPPSLPVVVLAGYFKAERRTFFIDYWEPALSITDLEALGESPAREAIRREVVRKLAVLLYVPGTNSDGGIAENVINSVVDAWSKREHLGLSVVQLNRTDKREQLLLSFIGVEQSGPDWVGVVFGRGKLMPPLIGSEITEDELNRLIECLLVECTCLRPPSSYGVDIPMLWEDNLDQAIVPLRNGSLGAGIGWNTWIGGKVEDSYTGGHVLIATMGTIAALVLVVSAATIVIVLRRHRRNTTSPFD